MSAFLSDLVVKLSDPAANDGTGQWELIEPLSYYSDKIAQTVTVPAGFSTDFASVPRKAIIAYGIFGGRAIRPAVVHDFLCRQDIVPRKKADLVFKEAMLVDGVPPAKALAMYDAVALYTSSGLWKG